MYRAWRHVGPPAIAALALVASHGETTRPEREARANMAEPPQVQLVTDNPPDVTLTCAIERREQAIRVHYFLSNQSDKTILVYDRVRFNPMNTLTLPVDVVCDAGDGSVNLVLGLSPDPLFSPHQQFTQPQHWGQELNRLGPSKNVAATVELALPLLEWDQWNANTAWSKVAAAEQAVQVHTARLVVDFVRPSRRDFKRDFPAESAESVWCAIPLTPPVTLLRHPGFGELGDPARLRAFNLGPDKVRDPEAAYAGHRERIKAQQEHRAHRTTPRRRGTSPADMPKAWHRQPWEGYADD
jgi:hypothetical protein